MVANSSEPLRIVQSRSELFRAEQIYRIDTSTRAFEEYLGVGEVGSDGWSEFEKTRRVPYGGFEPSFATILKHKTFAKGLMVERETMEDNQYPQAGIPKSVTQRVEGLADSASVFREKAAADVFNNAFTDTGVDDDFMKKLGAELDEGNAAVVLLIREVSADKVLPQIKIPGTIIQTSLSNEDEGKRIMRESGLKISPVENLDEAGRVAAELVAQQK